jgi:hypothetical protein
MPLRKRSQILLKLGVAGHVPGPVGPSVRSFGNARHAFPPGGGAGRIRAKTYGKKHLRGAFIVDFRSQVPVWNTLRMATMVPQAACRG